MTVSAIAAAVIAIATAVVAVTAAVVAGRSYSHPSNLS
jgi:hypothetical protein